MKKCKYCGKEFTDNTKSHTKKFCSLNHQKLWWLKSKQGRLYQKEYQKGWREKNPEKWKEIIRKSENRPERKEYNRQWISKNPNKVKAYYSRYQRTMKGILNQIKKTQARRDKFRKFESSLKKFTLKYFEEVYNRDKVCVYCRRKFSNDSKSRYKFTFDHLNPFKPFSKDNIVKCCFDCNRNKGNANAIEWCKFMGYKPMPIVYRLTKSIR